MSRFFLVFDEKKKKYMTADHSEIIKIEYTP